MVYGLLEDLRTSENKHISIDSTISWLENMRKVVESHADSCSETW